MLASAPILHHLLGRQRFLIFSQVQSLKALPFLPHLYLQNVPTSSADILDHILGKQKEEETFDQSSTMFHICQVIFHTTHTISNCPNIFIWTTQSKRT